MTSRAWRRATIVLSLAFGAAAGVRSDVEPLSLYQKAARASLVIRARALSSSTRRPELRVLEVIKGDYPHDTLVIAPRERDVRDTTPWLKREVFSEGEESLLFLVPYVDEFGRGEGPRTFAVLNADLGKVTVPSEGADALLQAVRQFASIQAMGQHDRQAAAIREMLRSKNPILVEAALDECRRFHLARVEDQAAIFGLMGHPRPDFRAGALVLLRQLVIEAPGSAVPEQGEGAPPGQAGFASRDAFDRVAALASLDPEESVRRAAVAAIEGFGHAAAISLLDRIGATDPSQAVRYEARVAAHRLREKRPAEGSALTPP